METPEKISLSRLIRTAIIVSRNCTLLYIFLLPLTILPFGGVVSLPIIISSLIIIIERITIKRLLIKNVWIGRLAILPIFATEYPILSIAGIPGGIVSALVIMFIIVFIAYVVCGLPIIYSKNRAFGIGLGLLVALTISYGILQGMNLTREAIGIAQYEEIINNRKRDFAESNFTVYKPTYLPAGGSSSRKGIFNEGNYFHHKNPRSLSYYSFEYIKLNLSKTTDWILTINSSGIPSSYQPPSDCGSDDTPTIKSYHNPCYVIGTTNNNEPIYYLLNLAGNEAIYRLSRNNNLITLRGYGKFPPDEIIKVINSLQAVPADQLEF